MSEIADTPRQQLRRLTKLMAVVGATLPMVGMFFGSLGYLAVALTSDPLVSSTFWHQTIGAAGLSASIGLPPGVLVLVVLDRQIERPELYRRRSRWAALAWLLLCAGFPIALLLAANEPSQVLVPNRAAELPAGPWRQVPVMIVFGFALAAMLAVFVSVRPAAIDRDTLRAAAAGAVVMSLAAVLLVISWWHGVLVTAAAMLPGCAFWIASVSHVSLRPYFLADDLLHDAQR